MFTIKDKDYIYIPLQYNMSWLGKRNKLNESLLKQDFLGELKAYVKTKTTYIWDFNNLDSINDRGLVDFFKDISKKRNAIILANVKSNSTLDRQIRYEILSYTNTKLFGCDGMENYLLGKNEAIAFGKDTIRKIRVNYLNDVINEFCIETKYQYLVSSGVYSNMQINMKNLFYHSEEFEYFSYLLWNNIQVKNVDGIIATSKNGVAFASILGKIMGLDVLYFNIGQMFEETYNCSPYVKKGGRYIHVFDVICLGSETKVLNALVNSQGGKVIRSVGCVCLLDLEIVAKKNRYSSMKQVTCLLGQNELTKEYKIYLKESEGDRL